jgi:hypothetical protein
MRLWSRSTLSLRLERSLCVVQNLKLLVSCSELSQSHFSIPLKALAIKVPAPLSDSQKTRAIRALLISKAAKLTSAKKACSEREREGDSTLSKADSLCVLEMCTHALDYARARARASDVRLDQIFIPSNMCAITSHEHTHLLPIDAVQGGSERTKLSIHTRCTFVGNFQTLTAPPFNFLLFSLPFMLRFFLATKGLQNAVKHWARLFMTLMLSLNFINIQ